MSSSSLKDMWFSSCLSYLYKICVIHKRVPLVMLKTPTCIHSIKHPSPKSRYFHFPRRLKTAQQYSLTRKLLCHLYISLQIHQRQPWKKNICIKNLFDPHRWSFIFLIRFFKLAHSDDFTRLGSLWKFLWPAHLTSFKWQNWGIILIDKHRLKRHWDFSLSSFLLLVFCLSNIILS